MRYATRLARPLALWLVLAGVSARAQDAADVDAALAEALDATFQGMPGRYGQEGAAAAVLLPGGARWTGAAGYSTYTPPEPIAPGMVFGIGSGTKSFTAALVLRLAEEGLLHLDDSLGAHLPGLAAHPNIDGSIPLRRLLNHTSGLGDYTAHPAFNELVYGDPGRVLTPEDILPLVGPPRFLPGASWGYSNTNFYLGGLVIEAVTGTDVTEAFRTYLFEPLGLTHTRFGWETAPAGQPWAHGWAGTTDLATLSPNANFSAAFTAGGLVSTAEEQARWAEALFGGRVLGPAALAEMMTAVPLDAPFFGGARTGYGLGCFRLRVGTATLWGHSGRIPGYTSNFVYDPARGVAISVVANRMVGSPDAMAAELYNVVAAVPVASERAPTDGAGLELRSAGANPFVASARISLRVPAAQHVTVDVLDALGRRVARLHEGALPAGAHVLGLDGAALAPGVYVVHARAGGASRVLRVVRGR